MKISNYTLLVLILSAGILLTNSSCQKEQVKENKAEEIVSLEESSISYPKIPESIIRKINRLPLVTQEIGFEKVTMPNGEIQEFYIIEKDIMITEQQLDQMIESKLFDTQNARHYRTLFTVSTPRTITIRGVNSGSSSLSFKQRQGLESSSRDINVKSQNFGSYGPLGISGYPNFFGDPFNLIRVNNNTSLAGLSNQLWEEILTHDIGHCVGLRHTDWFSRASCGLNVSEGSGSYGAIWIPGTAMGNDSLSIMSACGPISNDGEFSESDKIALNNLY